MRKSKVITPNGSGVIESIKEVLEFTDLLILLVRRDIIVLYKQTLLGPLWYLIQPIITTLIFTFVFGKLAKISTDGTPHIAFYFLGISFWNYFSESLNKTSNIFTLNQGIFGKVYFPRIIIPLSVITSGLLKFFIQLGLFLIIWTYYVKESMISPDYAKLIWIPFIVIVFMILSLALGMIFSSLTVKYKDLNFLMVFLVQIWMYFSPIIYPLNQVPRNYLKYVKVNPVTPLVEACRYAFLGVGNFDPISLLYSAVVSLTLLFIGLLVFSKVEKNFMDTV